jgi:hypothetical protein
MSEERDPVVLETIQEVGAEIEDARARVIEADAEIEKKENEIKTAITIGERDVSNFERQAKEAQLLGERGRTRSAQDAAAKRRSQLAEQVNELEAQRGALKNRRIEAGARQTALESRLAELKERLDEQARRQSVSDDQFKRAAALEERLGRLEKERAGLVEQIEKYAPIVEAQREAATSSGAAELSEAYAEQAEIYKEEWQRWLVSLAVAVLVALTGGVAVIFATHPASDATSSEIASRIAIEILVLGLLIYAVRITAHQFRVHRHLETVARGKAAALMTFNRLVAGPGEAEVRTAVAVALAQAVFDSSATGFIDSSQDGVTIVERLAAPVVQRLGDRASAG